LLDIKTLKRKIDSIVTNIAIYERDMAKHIKTLKLKGIESTDNYVEELKNKNKKLIDEKEKVLGKVDRILTNIER